MAEAGAAGGLLGTLYIRFTAQTDDLNKKVDESEKKVTKGAKAMEKATESLAHVLKALGLAWGIHEVVDFVKETIHGADELKKFSQEIGITINQLAGLKFAADKANIGDQFQMGMRKFAEALREAQVEGSNTQALFQQLKIDPKQLPNEAFKETVGVLGQMEDGVNKLGIVQELFGTRNARFVNLVSGGTQQLNKDIQELARITGMSYEEAATKAEAYNDAVVTIKYALQGLVLTVANDVLPVITEWANSIGDNLPMLQRMAKEIGTGLVYALGTAAVAFKGFMGALKLGAIGILGIIESVMKLSRWLADKLVIAFEFWANAAIQSIDFVIGGFNSLTDRLPDWIKKRLGITGGGEAIKPLELFSLAKPTGLDDWIDTVHDARQDLSNQLAEDFHETAKVVKDGNKEVSDALKEGVGGKGQKNAGFNPKELQDFQDRLSKQIGSNTPAGSSEFAKMRGGLRTEIGDITGIQGDARGSFKGQAELEEVDQHLKDIQKLRETHFDITKEQNARLTEMEKLYAEKRQAIQLAEVKLRLNVASDMFSNLADITKAWAGEQSGIYKAMFAVSKAFAIAEATVKIAQGIAAAAANPWPLNLFAMASVIAATASIVSSIQAVQLEFGGERAMGGPVSADKAFLVGERGPEMFVPSRNGSIVPNNRLGGPMQPKVIVNNFSDARPEVSTRDEGTESVIEVLVRKVEDRMGSNVRSGTGSLNRSLQDSFNLRRGQGNT
jgi:hypothetical protein